MGTQITIENELLYPNSTRTLISYRGIRKNGLHVVTHEENNEEFLQIIKKYEDRHDILKRIPSLSSRLYYTYIKYVPHVAYKVNFQNVDAFTIWHEWLGHLRVGMMSEGPEKVTRGGEGQRVSIKIPHRELGLYFKSDPTRLCSNSIKTT
jgi:hypothetical protein